jgi:hypothetical protein
LYGWGTRVRIFKLKAFARFARGERIKDEALSEAVERAARGLVDADLGGGIIKQRVARPGQGRSGGFRVVLAFRAKHRAVFVFGFAKNDLDNIDADQLATLREAAALWLKADMQKIERAIKDGLIIEVPHDD